MEMAVPAAIRQQVAEAEALQQQLYGQEQAESPAEQTAEVAEAPSVPVVEQQPAEPAVEVKPEPVAQSDEWKQKYDTLKGMFDSQVPKLHQELKARDSQLQSLQSRLEALEKQPEPAKEESLLTDKDTEDFGADLVDMVKRAARAEAQTMIKAALAAQEKQFAGFMSSLGAVQERVVMSESEKFWGRVEALVPDWQAIDNDPEWIAFLDTSPEFTTKTYRELAAEAIAAGKAEAIVSLVRIWRPAVQQPVAPAQPNPELQRQVAPPTVKSSTPVNPAEKILSKADYESLYDPRNVQRYGQKKADEMIAEADRAVAEGRVRW